MKAVGSEEKETGQASLIWWSFYWCSNAPLEPHWGALYLLDDRPWADVDGICPFWPRIGLSDPRPRHPHPESAADV